MATILNVILGTEITNSRLQADMFGDEILRSQHQVLFLCADQNNMQKRNGIEKRAEKVAFLIIYPGRCDASNCPSGSTLTSVNRPHAV
jgi:hypothetical protein